MILSIIILQIDCAEIKYYSFYFACVVILIVLKCTYSKTPLNRTLLDQKGGVKIVLKKSINICR